MTVGSSLHQTDSRIEALDQAVRAFGEAWAMGDVAKLKEALSPTYTHQDVWGRFQDCAMWLAYAGARRGMTTGISFHDIRRRIVGDVAIITGMNVITGEARRNPDDVEVRVDKSVHRIRFTQIWAWRNDRWLREAFQATPTSDLPDPAIAGTAA